MTMTHIEIERCAVLCDVYSSVCTTHIHPTTCSMNYVQHAASTVLCVYVAPFDLHCFYNYVAISTIIDILVLAASISALKFQAMLLTIAVCHCF
jgi:hypothetical protein